MSRPLVVDLSIDFDFFVRENPWWDWGHDERSTIFMERAWAIRYKNGLGGLGPDVVKETDPATHADFLPLRLPEELQAKNLLLGTRRAVRVADSHVHAYDMLTRTSAPDVLLNIDAHHDVFSTGPLHCGNWLYHYAQKRPTVRLVQLYPQWKWRDQLAGEGDGAGHLPRLELRSFQSFAFAEPVRVRDIFLCRSGTWVPPHLDDQFQALAVRLAKGASSYGFAGDLVPRAAPDFEQLKADGEALAAQVRAVEALASPAIAPRPGVGEG